MKILAFGDVVGKPGRQVLKKHVVCLRRELAVDFVFANGENAAGGIGLTRETLDEILSCGVDAVTGRQPYLEAPGTLLPYGQRRACPAPGKLSGCSGQRIRRLYPCRRT